MPDDTFCSYTFMIPTEILCVVVVALAVPILVFWREEVCVIFGNLQLFPDICLLLLLLPPPTYPNSFSSVLLTILLSPIPFPLPYRLVPCIFPNPSLSLYLVLAFGLLFACHRFSMAGFHLYLSLPHPTLPYTFAFLPALLYVFLLFL